MNGPVPHKVDPRQVGGLFLGAPSIVAVGIGEEIFERVDVAGFDGVLGLIEYGADPGFGRFGIVGAGGEREQADQDKAEAAWH